MIYIISNRPSGLWGLFSGPIIGLPVVVRGHKAIIDKFIIDNNIDEDLWEQSKIFGNNFWDINNNNFIYDDGKVINNIRDIYIGIGENLLNISLDYHILSSTFMEEISELSELLGQIYKTIPNKPPLSSIPHSTSTIKI